MQTDGEGVKMKKCYVIFLITFLSALLIIFPNISFTADPLHRMLHADEYEEFAKDQDAVIVGQIIEKTENYFNVKVLKCISGKIDSENILIEKDFGYAGFSEGKSHPAVDDFCVLSVKMTGDAYKIAWTAAKADSGDYKTLKLIYEAKEFGGGDIPAIQWYVNSGGTEKDFFFKSDKAFVKRPDGEVVDITDIAIELGKDYSVEQSDTYIKDSDEQENSVNNGETDEEKYEDEEAEETQPEEAAETVNQNDVTDFEDANPDKQDESNKAEEGKNYSVLYCVVGIFLLLMLAIFFIHKYTQNKK